MLEWNSKVFLGHFVTLLEISRDSLETRAVAVQTDSFDHPVAVYWVRFPFLVISWENLLRSCHRYIDSVNALI